MDSWEVSVSADEVDLASGLLWGAGVSGIIERDDGPGRVVLVAAVEGDAIDEVPQVVGDRWALHAATLDPDASADGWRAWARAVRVGRRLVVQPPWVEPIAVEGDLVVSLDPGRAWGHGAHPTTTMVLAALCELDLAGARVLDVGCGSGALSVAASLLGATTVVAIDVDPAAVEATSANAIASGAAGIEVSTTPLAEVEGRFDVVVANVGAAFLRDTATLVVARCDAGATVVLSGMLREQGDGVADVYDALGWHVVRRLDDGDWCALELRRQGVTQ